MARLFAKILETYWLKQIAESYRVKLSDDYIIKAPSLGYICTPATSMGEAQISCKSFFILKIMWRYPQVILSPSYAEEGLKTYLNLTYTPAASITSRHILHHRENGTFSYHPRAFMSYLIYVSSKTRIDLVKNFK